MLEGRESKIAQRVENARKFDGRSQHESTINCSRNDTCGIASRYERLPFALVYFTEDDEPRFQEAVSIAILIAPLSDIYIYFFLPHTRSNATRVRNWADKIFRHDFRSVVREMWFDVKFISPCIKPTIFARRYWTFLFAQRNNLQEFFEQQFSPKNIFLATFAIPRLLFRRINLLASCAKRGKKIFSAKEIVVASCGALVMHEINFPPFSSEIQMYEAGKSLGRDGKIPPHLPHRRVSWERESR